MLSFPTLVIEKTILTALLGVALVIFVVITVILRYHWKRFGFGETAVLRMRRFYGLVSTLLLISAVIFYLLNIMSL